MAIMEQLVVNYVEHIYTMGNFMHTAFKAYCGVLLGPV